MADYPAHLARELQLADGRRVVLRPIRAEDEPAARRFFERLSGEAKELRFMEFVGSLDERLIHFFTHVDYDKHMAFVCEHNGQVVGDARYVANPDGRSCEFGVVVADDWRRSGIGRLLMSALMRAAQLRGLETMEGLVRHSNGPMLRFVTALGFEIEPVPEDLATVRAVKRLQAVARSTSSSAPSGPPQSSRQGAQAQLVTVQRARQRPRARREERCAEQHEEEPGTGGRTQRESEENEKNPADDREACARSSGALAMASPVVLREPASGAPGEKLVPVAAHGPHHRP